MSPSRAPGPDAIKAIQLRKAWPVMGQDITRLVIGSWCLREAVFPEPWKTAKLVVIPKSGKKDRADPKSYRPVSLLPAISKALETLIIQDLENETGINDFSPQHGFMPGRSTVTAIESMYNWIDSVNSRHVFGVFLDITGAFDNVGWFSVISKLEDLGASLRTTKMITSYLKDRTATLTMEGRPIKKQIERGCPKGSQLGPTLWKVAMTGIGEIQLDNNSPFILNADDIALLTGAARPATAFTRIEKYLEELRTWATGYSLTFSPAKSQVLALKGGLKPGYTINFGEQADADKIQSSSTVKYLGVILDSRRSYWNHIKALANKSSEMYSTAKAIYSAVFLPRITYASTIWSRGSTLEKSIKALNSIQRAPLLAITSGYRTASTNCLAAVAGVLPLDLEIRRATLKSHLRSGAIDLEGYNSEVDRLITVWQERYESTDKGGWTKYMIPSVALRLALPLELDHYTTQFLTGHGDFNSKLHSFKLVRSPNCACSNGAKTVRHVHTTCTRITENRRELIEAMRQEGEAWPPRSGAFLRSRKTYEALRKFSRETLLNRSDR